MGNNASLIIPLGGRVDISLLGRALQHARYSGHGLIIVADRSPSVFSMANYCGAISMAKSMADIFLESPEESFYRRGSIWLKLQQGAQVATRPWLRFCGYDDLTYPSAHVPEGIVADAICTDVGVEESSLDTRITRFAPRSGLIAALRGWRNPFSFIGWTVTRSMFISESMQEICLKGAHFFEHAMHVALFSSEWYFVEGAIFGGCPIRTEHRGTISTQAMNKDFFEKSRIAESISNYSSTDLMADWNSLNMRSRVAQMILKNIMRPGSCVLM